MVPGGSQSELLDTGADKERISIPSRQAGTGDVVQMAS